MQHSPAGGCLWVCYRASVHDSGRRSRESKLFFNSELILEFIPIIELNLQRIEEWKFGADLTAALGECPVWHGQQLWLVDCREGVIYALDTDTGEVTARHEAPPPLGAFGFNGDDGAASLRHAGSAPQRVTPRAVDRDLRPCHAPQTAARVRPRVESRNPETSGSWRG